MAKSAGSCPGCGVKKPVRSTSWVAWGGLALVVYVGAKACSGSHSTAANTDATPVAAAAVVPETPAASPVPVKIDKLSAGTLLQAYSANEIAADAKYKGKRFRVTGTVAAIKSDITDDPQVWLVSELNPVVANGLTKAFAGTLNKGDNMSASCNVSGSIIGMPTLDCSGPQSQ
ncbi:MAG: hypothetical protein ABI548_23400 [Polyangiaceae bacterium]